MAIHRTGSGQCLAASIRVASTKFAIRAFRNVQFASKFLECWMGGGRVITGSYGNGIICLAI